MPSSSETRCGSAMFQPPGRRGRGSHTGEVVHKDHPKRKRYILPILPISARCPWDHPRGCLAPQLGRLGRPPRVLVGLLLVENLFLLPPLMVKKDQFHRRIESFITKIGDQNMLLAETNRS